MVWMENVLLYAVLGRTRSAFCIHANEMGVNIRVCIRARNLDMSVVFELEDCRKLHFCPVA